jgi:hypothetical protein
MSMASAMEWDAVLAMAQIGALAWDAVLLSPMLLPWVSQLQLQLPSPLGLESDWVCHRLPQQGCQRGPSHTHCWADPRRRTE